MKRFTILPIITLFLVSFNLLGQETNVADIAELRDQNEDETIYVITGEVFITYQSDQRNQKAIQDASGAAILIDDDDGIITTDYNLYDGITGLKGTLSSFNNLLQFVPAEDPGAPSSTGNTIEPTVVTLSEITPDHQSLLIRVNDVEITEDAAIFESSTSYDIADPSGSSTLRTPSGSADLDYFNTVIPSGANDMIAIVSQFNESMQIFPRFLEDIYLMGVPTFTVTFSVKDESDTDITDAVITLGETTAAAGEYVFEDVAMGEYNYTVEKDGFITAENMLFINGEGDVSETVVLQEEGGLIINTFPYEVGLDADIPPADWSSYSLGDAGEWESTPNAYDGDAAGLHSFTDDGQMADSWLVSPRIAIGDTEELLLKFYERNSFMSAYDYSGVKISTSSGNPEQEQFVEVYESSAEVADYTERVIDLSPYQGEIIYIAFHYQGQFAHQWFIDEISVEFVPEAIQVTDIASLRQQEQGTLIYELTSEAIITHMHGQRNQKYIQDASGAAVVIDDPDGIITTGYNLYDGITGLKGTLGNFNNLIQFSPVEDPGAPSSTDNEIQPQVVTLNELTPDHQALLIYVEGVSFTGGETTFESSTSYDIADASGSSIFRTPSGSAGLDYFDMPIPTEPTNMIAVVSQFADDMQIFARSSSDFDAGMNTNLLSAKDIKVFPNPFNEQIVIEAQSSVSEIRILNNLGQVIFFDQNPSDQIIIDTHDLNSGLYFIQLSDAEGNPYVHKIIKQ